MSTVAEQLHQGREAKHLTVEQVAEITRDPAMIICARSKKAISMYSPGSRFISGDSYCTYSTLLKLDVAKRDGCA